MNRRFPWLLGGLLVVATVAYAATPLYDGMDFRGATSGTVALSAQSVAGTPTIKLPTTSGTLPTTATSPLVLNATTGALTCPTCGSGPGSTTVGHVATWNSTDGTILADGGSLGTAATANTGTSGATIPLLNGANTWSSTQTFGSTVASINTQSGTSYTLVATDCGKTIRFTSGSAITLTTLNSLSAGCYVNIEQGGAGQVTVASGAGATLQSSHSYTKTFGQYALIGLFVEANSGGTAAALVLYGDGA